ncbi:MAG TPA: PD-(D/E)XK nuclease family protein [Gemmatimonadales bacterium]|nr:PD-(D/E)XK nuclease family protein [Gemmatimonadales bacterium]
MNLPSSSAAAAAAASRSPARPLRRRWLLGPTINWGREALVALARRDGGHIGWEAVTLRGIAEELAFTAREARVAGDLELQLLLDQALADLLPTLDLRYTDLAARSGFRTSVGDTVLELRVAGVRAEEILARADEGSPAAVAGQVLARYEELLGARRLLDPAALFTLALERFDDEAPYVLPDEIHVAPHLAPRGLPKLLHDRLVARGATPFPLPPVPGDQGTIFFAATTPIAELRECLRRAVAEGVPFDEVEFVYTDPDSYGIAFEALLQHLDLRGSALLGVPWRRTLVGRTVGSWWRWLGDGLPADQLRALLESGQFGPAPVKLFRDLGIGWGRARYDAALVKLESCGLSKALRPYDDEDPEQFETRRAELAADEGALASLLQRVLAATPPVPERGGDTGAPISVGELARHTREFLSLLTVEPESGEGHTATRLRNRLTTLAEHDDGRRLPFGVALAELMAALDDLRAWPGTLYARKPWSAQGGKPHLTDLAHAGTTGRRRVFVVGLDADRVAGPRLPDPILTDDLRAALGADRLATTADRRADRRRLVHEALATLGANVTLSYARSSDDGRAAAPAPVLLERYREAAALPAATYEELLAALGAPAGPVPTAGALDRRDIWLGALGAGPVLRDGRAQVRAAHPGLDRGLATAATWEGTELTAAQGLVPAAAKALDPRSAGRPVSPSALELLAKCPLAFFYSRGLGLRAPEDPEYDPGRWLDPAQRGTLLHEVFERFGRAWQARQAELGGDEARSDLFRILDERLAAWRADVPPPSEFVYVAEARELRHAAEAFLAYERQRLSRAPGRRLAHFELGFPVDGKATGFPEPGAWAIPVRGRIDRVDALPDGELVALDYKTGSTHAYRRDPKLGPFRGGRSLQPAIYAAAATQLLGAAVRAFEYLFPTAKGRNTEVRYEADELRAAAGVVEGLLAHTAAATFIPTTDPGDCKYCDFRAVCRVQAPRFEKGNGTSPRAEWAKEVGAELPEYAGMLRRRTKS